MVSHVNIVFKNGIYVDFRGEIRSTPNVGALGIHLWVSRKYETNKLTKADLQNAKTGLSFLIHLV